MKLETEEKKEPAMIEVFDIEVDQLLDHLRQTKRLMELWIGRLSLMKRYRKVEARALEQVKRD